MLRAGGRHACWITRSELKLGAKAVDVLKKGEINGESLLNLNEDNLMRVGMPLGPATILAAAIAELPRTSEWIAPRHLVGPAISRPFRSATPFPFSPSSLSRPYVCLQPSRSC